MIKGILQTVVTVLLVIAVAKLVKPYLPAAVASYLPS
jgi:hypothetical protein